MTKLQYKRLISNITQKQLSELTGIARSQIAAYETGLRNPGVNTLFKLSEVLNCDIVDLVGDIKTNGFNKYKVQ